MLLDGDAAGQRAKRRYAKEFLLSSNEIFVLSDICPTVQQTEAIFSPEDILRIAGKLGIPPKDLGKPELNRFFQEILAAGSKFALSKTALQNARRVVQAMKAL